jgi:hypothetical protein
MNLDHNTTPTTDIYAGTVVHCLCEDPHTPKYMRLGGLKTEVDIAREGEGQAG